MAKQVVLQSFVNHDVIVNFRYVEGDDVPKDMAVGDVVRVNGALKTVKVPSKRVAPKNILILTPADFKATEKDLSSYLKLGQRGGIVKLDDIPSGYWDPAQRVASAEAKASAAEARVMAAEAKLKDLQAENDELRKKLREYGWKG